ncbi:hypothetical protein G6F56_012319 [Rhizopus delemar]|nr:hypothetical protein G6F56_012319 [Rhizopus delemar]
MPKDLDSIHARKYLPNLSKVTAPLNKLRFEGKLTSKVWGQEQDDAFTKIKQLLASAPVLYHPDLNEPFYVATDASNYSIGAVLYQIIDKQICHLGFMARALSTSEKNYSTTKRELLAIVFALKKFHPFLWGNPFTLYTDHIALTYIHTQKYANTMMMNWFDTILDYQFKVIHLPGMDNILPDHLSRLFPTDQMLRGSEQDIRAKNGIIHTAIRAIRSNKHKKFTVKKPAQYKQCDYMTPPENERKQLMLRAHLMGHFGAENIYTHIYLVITGQWT